MVQRDNIKVMRLNQVVDWGRAIALIAIGALLGASVLLTIRGDLGYLVDAFT